MHCRIYAILIHYRTITYLNAMTRTIPYLNALPNYTLSSFITEVIFHISLGQKQYPLVLYLTARDMNSPRHNICPPQTLLDVKRTVFSTATTVTTSIRCQHLYSLTQVSPVFIQYMQLFISSKSDRKKLQGFTMLMYPLL